jgi:hypothetical protein
MCRSVYTVQIIQDIRKPYFTLTAQTNSIINCYNPSVTIIPIITPTLAAALVPTYTWFAPSVGPGVPGSSFQTTVAGTHTALCASSVNGCTTSSTYNVFADFVPPSVTNGTFGVNCPFTGQATISPVYGSTINLTYTWTSFPAGAVVSMTDKSFLIADKLGDYVATITNTINGCSQTVTVTIDCSIGLPGRILSSPAIVCYPNPSNGILNIELNSALQNVKISIFDLQGKFLMDKQLAEVNNVIYTNLPKGCYFYRIYQGDTLLKRDKLLIE